MMAFKFFLGGGLHSHTYYANTDLFNFFTANFTAKSTQIESKQKDTHKFELNIKICLES